MAVVLGQFTQKLRDIVDGLKGSATLTEENISQAVRRVRLALLDADVNYVVAKSFIAKVKEKALGVGLVKSVSPADQFIKILHDELTDLMGKEEPTLIFDHHPSVVLLCGLQGSGKTTTAGKLAYFLKKKGKKPLLCACDLQRAAAVDQLEKLGADMDVPVVSIHGESRPKKVAKLGLERAKKEGFDVLIVDTAGRLHIDDDLMDQLVDIKKLLNPHETLFVANAATGQDAVTTAGEFDKRIGITGSILTMLDGQARAGAAISILEVTKKPLKFEGIGEGLGDLQLFNPVSMADRILGMGDVINLVKRAQDVMDQETTDDLEKKLRKASFTFDDFLKQLRNVKKLGSIKNILKMIPAFGKMGDIDVDDNELVRIEAIILSMTQDERLGIKELAPSRRRRIAQGSGRGIDEVNKIIKMFKRMKQMMKKMPQFQRKMMKEESIKKQLSSLPGASRLLPGK